MGGELFRAKDRQRVIRETVKEFTRCIDWDGSDAQRLKHFGNNVVLGPRSSVLGSGGVDQSSPQQGSVGAIVGLWRAGEPLSSIAHEYAMRPRDVETSSSSSTPGTALAMPPKFFVDRALGTSVTQGLRSLAGESPITTYCPTIHSKSLTRTGRGTAVAVDRRR